MKAPQISIIICTYNRSQYLGRCLEALSAQAAAREMFEVVLVDNNSTDSTSEIVADFEARYGESVNFRPFLETNQGLSFARNRGVQEAQGDILVFLDDDAFARPDYVDNLLSFYNNHPEAAATGGRTYPEFEADKPDWMSRYLMSLVAAMDLGDEPKLFPRGMYPIGANMSLRRTAIESIGSFNTALGRKGSQMLGGEEKDIFLRLRAKGFQLWYVPDAIVQHIIPANRLTQAAIKKQARGIGFSERLRVSQLGLIETLWKFSLELMKWIATVMLFIWYSATGPPFKGWMLVKFRYWVSQGLFFRKL